MRSTYLNAAYADGTLILVIQSRPEHNQSGLISEAKQGQASLDWKTPSNTRNPHMVTAENYVGARE